MGTYVNCKQTLQLVKKNWNCKCKCGNYSVNCDMNLPGRFGEK